MKRASLLLIAFIYTLTCLGISFQYHMCKGKLVAVSIQQPLDGHRCCDQSKMKDDCCKDITKIVKLEQAGLKLMQVKLAQLVPITLPIVVFPIIDLVLQRSNAAVSSDFHPPPLPSSVPRHLAFGVILV